MIHIKGFKELIDKFNRLKIIAKQIIIDEAMVVANEAYNHPDVIRSYPFDGPGESKSEIAPQAIPAAFYPDYENAQIKINLSLKAHERELRRHEAYGAVKPLMLIRQNLNSEWNEKISKAILAMLK